jgi:hypothetical protein
MQTPGGARVLGHGELLGVAQSRFVLAQAQKSGARGGGFKRGVLQSRCKLALPCILCRLAASNVMKTLASWAPAPNLTISNKLGDTATMRLSNFIEDHNERIVNVIVAHEAHETESHQRQLFA